MRSGLPHSMTGLKPFFLRRIRLLWQGKQQNEVNLSSSASNKVVLTKSFCFVFPVTLISRQVLSVVFFRKQKYFTEAEKIS